MERLIRTDKNGTKYYEDDCCPKCDGRGYIACYSYVEGGRCFLCGGSGFYLTHRKEMTPEYAALLQSRRDAKRARKAEEFNANIAEHYKALGLNAEGRGYAVMSDSFARKDEIKAAGGRWNGAFWYFAEPVEGFDLEEFDAVPFLLVVPADGVCQWDEDSKEWGLKQFLKDIRKRRREAENVKNPTSFYGEVGDKVETKVEFAGWFQFETTDFRGNDTMMYGYRLKDDEGHVFVWVTGTYPWNLFAENEDGTTSHFGEREWIDQKIGTSLTLKGRVKAHKEREGLKETQMTRCKFVFDA